MAIRTGAGPQRGIRRSDLLLGWHARHGSLNAYTGQPGLFVVVLAGTPGSVQGQNGAVVSAARGLPRWQQIPGQGSGYGSPVATRVTRLALAGDLVGQDVERLDWAVSWRVQPISFAVRVWPGYAAGSSVTGSPWVLLIGNLTTGGGFLGLRRTSTSWQAIRTRGATSITSSFVEPGGTTYPIDLLVTFGTGGVLQLKTRDKDGVLRDGNQATDASLMVLTETWGGGKVFLGSDGRYSFESVKIAKGTKTLADMDALT